MFDERKHPRDEAGKFTDGTTDYSENKYPQYLARTMVGKDAKKQRMCLMEIL